MDCSFAETLRLYPILPVLSRRCVENYTIPGTNKIIEKGIEVFIPVMAIQRESIGGECDINNILHYAYLVI